MHIDVSYFPSPKAYTLYRGTESRTLFDRLPQPLRRWCVLQALYNRAPIAWLTSSAGLDQALQGLSERPEVPDLGRDLHQLGLCLSLHIPAAGD